MLSVVYRVIFALLFYSSGFRAFAAAPQVPIQELNQCPDPDNGYDCGYHGLGFYRIINYGFQYAATPNGSTSGAAVLSMCVYWPAEKETRP